MVIFPDKYAPQTNFSGKNFVSDKKSTMSECMGKFICGSAYKALHSETSLIAVLLLVVFGLWLNKDVPTDGSKSDFAKAKSTLNPVRLTAVPL